MMPPSRKFVPIVRPDPDFSCYLRGSLFTGDTHEMPSLWTLQKVRKFRKLIITLFYLGLLVSPTSSLPLDQPHTTIKESRNKITVQVKGCKPLTSEELRSMLGPAFDESKMIYDDASLKRSMTLQDMQGDEAGDDDEFADNFDDDIDDETEIDTLGDTKNAPARVRENSFYMRRKRAVRATDDSEKLNSRLDSQFLYQNLLHDTVRAHSRRKRSYRNSYKPTPPWKCDMSKTIRILEKGYFPKRIFDGTCSQEKCFYGMYSCNPVRFSVKVLKKDPDDACRPVPLIGENTTYEESWVIRREHVTVACQCEYASSSSNKKRNKVRLKS